MKQDLGSLLFAFRTLARLVLTNLVSSSQSILDDAFFLVRSIIADTADEVAQRASKTADAIRPEETTEEHSQIQELENENLPRAADLEEKQQELKDTLKETGNAATEATSQTQGLKQKAFDIESIRNFARFGQQVSRQSRRSS